MIYDFDTEINRRGTGSAQWQKFPADVLPMWIADMDYRPPEAVLQALQKQLDLGVFGYPETIFPTPNTAPRLREAIVGWLGERYGWQVTPEEIVLLPGVVTAFNLACHAFAAGGGDALVMTPVYQPMHEAPGHAGLKRADTPWRLQNERWELDWGVFQRTISPQAKILLLCNPHNPLGRVFRREELESIANHCMRNGVTICADEIHSDLVYSGYRHIPIATLSTEVAQNTITLMAPSKTFNLAGLQCSFAVIQDPALRQRFLGAQKGLVSWVTGMAVAGATAAYAEGAEWLRQLLVHLEGNRNFLTEFVQRELPGITMIPPEATFLAWLDCRGLPGIAYEPAKFFLEKARLGLSEGASFGPGGQGFVRLNFACPRPKLAEALERMKAAIRLTQA